MKILVIMGSPRKGNTYHAAERIRDFMQKRTEVEWEYVMLRDLHIEQCRGCASCIVRGEEFCPIKDDAASLEKKMQGADGVIFATPVYALQVTGLMKAFIDRHAYVCHRPRFFAKKALLLTTAGAIGNREVLDYLYQLVRIWGFDVADQVGLLVEILPEYRRLENEQRLETAAEAFLAALRSGSPSRPGLMDVIIFHGMRASFDELKEMFPADYAYWTDKGWMEKDTRYFMDVPVNPIYHAAAMLLEWYQRRQIRKDKRDMS